MISDLRAYEPIPTIYRVFVSDCSKDSAFRIAELVAQAGQPGQTLS